VSQFEDLFGEEDETVARVHSRFAPSSLARILACPRSVSLGEAVAAAAQTSPGQKKASGYAAEGSVAHTVAEAHLRRAHGENVEMPLVGTTTTVDGHTVLIDTSMHVHGSHYAKEIVGMLLPGDELFIEKTVNMDAALPGAGMYGHLDVAIWSPSTSTLHDVDYKYGRGIVVSAVDNAQMKAYAYGALTSLPSIDPDDVKIIKTHIIQPRVPTKSPVDTMPAVDLLMWMFNDVKPVIEEIMRDGAINRPYVTGPQCRYCPAKSACPALRDRALHAAQKAFGAAPTPPTALSDKELSQIVSEAEIIEPFIDAAKDELLDRVNNGGVAGWKSVPTRPARVWASPDWHTAEELRQLGLTDKQIYEAKLRTPPQIEKLVAGNEGTLSHLWTSKSSGVKLARSEPGASAAEVFSKSPLSQKDT
jgi:hypothetical protein